MRLFVPGRVCLFGEHSDWAGGYRRANPGLEKGYTLICGTEEGIYADVLRHPRALVLNATTSDGEHHGPVSLPLDADALLAEAQGGGFWSYIAGTAYQVSTRYRVAGLVLDNFRTTLPIGKGLSSSAAICVLTARAFGQMYGLGLSVRDEMELAYLGETTTPSRCGRMDQGCAFGGQPALMTFDGDQLDVAELVVGQDIPLILVDLGAHKDTPRILRDLNRCFPDGQGEMERGVQQLLGPINKRIVARAVGAIRAGNAQLLGALMTEAQSFFDRYALPACPGELIAPTLHWVLNHPALALHVWGGKGVGSQGDGAAQFVARSLADQQAAADTVRRELGLSCLALTLRASTGGSGEPSRAVRGAAQA
ncbi:MAG TPA: GHMP kinase [Anaerolineae bacterium]|nr:GHMP kinase [Anaerolineae bacterium]